MMSTERVKHQPGPVAHRQSSTFSLLQETVPCNFPSQTSSTGKAHLFFFRIYTTASSLYLKVSQPGPLDLPMAASFPESSAQRHDVGSVTCRAPRPFREVAFERRETDVAGLIAVKIGPIWRLVGRTNTCELADAPPQKREESSLVFG